MDAECARAFISKWNMAKRALCHEIEGNQVTIKT